MYRGKYEAKNRGGNQPVRRAAPQPQQTQKRPQVKNKKEKTKASPGTLIFYTLYAIMILVAAVGIWFGMGWVENWLVDFEASQPDAKCQEVFDQHFANPDWKQVYDLLDSDAVANISKESFAGYMAQRIGDGELTYSKTSAGLSGGRKFILRLDGKNIGTFTLTNSVTGEMEIPDWKLSHVEIFISANESVTVLTTYGNTVMVNGQPLEESNIVRTTSTVAQEYLPEGVHGPRTATYYIDGLLNAPEVEVTDASGNAVALSYDPQTKTYTEDFEITDNAITQSEYDFVLEATKTYFRFMLDVVDAAKLRQYFDSTSETYKTIIKSEDPWLQNFRTYDFGAEHIYDFCRYGEDLFSVRIAMDLNVTRTNGTIKTFSVDTTFFLARSGKTWRVIEMTNVDVAQILTQVRLTYLQDGQVLSSGMIDTECSTLETPSVTVPEGKVFSGWFLQGKDDKGDTTYTRVFQPDENGTVKLPADYVLEPMELHALFEEAK